MEDSGDTHWNFNEQELQSLLERPAILDVSIQKRQKEFFGFIAQLLIQDHFMVDNYPVLLPYIKALEESLTRQPTLFEIIGAINIAARSL